MLVNEYNCDYGDKARIHPMHGDPIDLEGLASDINNARTVVLYNELWTFTVANAQQIAELF